MSSNPRLLAPVALGALVVTLTATLNGCAAITGGLLHRHEEDFSAYRTAAEHWVSVPIPAWIPKDATDLRNVASDDEAASVVRVSTDSDLAASCQRGDRRSVPPIARDWVPKAASTSDDVLDCGWYQVVKVDDGYVGWFLARETGQRPDDPLPGDGARD